MQLLLALSPFAAFLAAERLFGTTVGFAAGALVSCILLGRDRLRGRHEVKLLELATALLFSGLAIWATAVGAVHWSVAGVRLRMDGSPLLIVMASMVLRRPFTLQYTKARVSAEVVTSPAFLRLNMVLAAAWALALGVLALVDLLLIVQPEVPTWIAVVLTLAALAGALKFTTWYLARIAYRAGGRTDPGVVATWARAS